MTVRADHGIAHRGVELAGPSENAAQGHQPGPGDDPRYPLFRFADVNHVPLCQLLFQLPGWHASDGLRIDVGFVAPGVQLITTPPALFESARRSQVDLTIFVPVGNLLQGAPNQSLFRLHGGP